MKKQKSKNKFFIFFLCAFLLQPFGPLQVLAQNSESASNPKRVYHKQVITHDKQNINEVNVPARKAVEPNDLKRHKSMRESLDQAKPETPNPNRKAFETETALTKPEKKKKMTSSSKRWLWIILGAVGAGIAVAASH